MGSLFIRPVDSSILTNEGYKGIPPQGHCGCSHWLNKHVGKIFVNLTTDCLTSMDTHSPKFGRSLLNRMKFNPYMPSFNNPSVNSYKTHLWLRCKKGTGQNIQFNHTILYQHCPIVIILCSKNIVLLKLWSTSNKPLSKSKMSN